MGRARLDAISSMCCPSNVSPWQVMDHLTRNIHETLSSRPKIQDLMHILNPKQCCSIRTWKGQTFWQVYPSIAINHLLLAWNWWVSINFAGLWVDLDIWNDHLQLGFHINIVRVRREGVSSSIPAICSAHIWLVDWSSILFSDWSIGSREGYLARYLEFSSCLEFDWIGCQWGATRSSSLRYQSPKCILDQHQYRYHWWNISTTFLALGVFHRECF